MTLTSSFLVHVDQVSVSHSGAGTRRLILDQVSLTVNREHITTIIGPNGAGKTTLIKVILGLMIPHSGTVKKAQDLKIGYMPQRMRLNPLMPLTVNRYLQLASPKSNDLIQERINQILHQVGVFHLADYHLADLSGGELQRVMLGFALMGNPNLLILDEPDQGIDVLGQAELYQLINDIRMKEGCSILLVSHDLHIVMAASDKIICLNGHVCCSGHPDQVQLDPSYHKLFGQYIHHHDHRHDHSACEHP